MLIRKSYEFTCLIIAIFGKDCQAFFHIWLSFSYFFRQQKTPGLHGKFWKQTGLRRSIKKLHAEGAW